MNLLRQELEKLAKSIKGKRVIGSLECIKPADVDEDVVRDVAEKHELLWTIYLDANGEVEIIYLKPEAKEHLEKYLTYLKHGDLGASLTPQEHYKLGLSFGFPKSEARWFEGEMKEELRMSNPEYRQKKEERERDESAAIGELQKHNIMLRNYDLGVMELQKNLTPIEIAMVTQILRHHNLEPQFNVVRPENRLVTHILTKRPLSYGKGRRA